MRRLTGLHLLAVVTIALVSLGVAVVTFGVLDSTGSSDNGITSIGGAIVGFALAFGGLSTLFRSLERANHDDRTRILEREVAELSQKLLRGAPRPPGYSVELLEHHRLVLARPTGFESKGGVILDIQEPDGVDEKRPTQVLDAIPARLFVNYIPGPRSMTPDDYYRDYVERTKDNHVFDVMGIERTIIGSDPGTCDALRVTTRRRARVTLRVDPISGRLNRSMDVLPRHEWDAVDVGPCTVEVPTGDLTTTFKHQVVVPYRQSVVVCFNTELERVFFVGFEDDETHFVDHVEAFHQCLRSLRFLT